MIKNIMILALLCVSSMSKADDSTGPVFPGGPKSIVSIAAGEYRSCAMSESTLACWGNNGYGQSPQLIRGFKHARHLSMGHFKTCVNDDDNIWCFGMFAGDVPYLESPHGIGVGYSHSCALTKEGVECWGDNSHGQAGVPSGLRNPRAIVTGEWHSCSLDDGGVKCWGYNGDRRTSVPSGLRNPRRVAVGFWHSCSLDDEGLKCWGNNERGQTNVPSDLKNPREMAPGAYHTCALDDEGVKCWGYNENGRANVPSTLRNPRAISAGGTHTCALDDEGITCWGYVGQAVPAYLFKAAPLAGKGNRP